MNINGFFEEQLRRWPDARQRFESLGQIEKKSIRLADGTMWNVVFNPSRARSTAAPTDAAAISARPCFLCKSNRPAEQTELDFGDCQIMVNPYPIFPGHLTVVAKEHTPQAIAGHVSDMARVALALPDHTLFYNGPRCGASAPDHLHFQAVPSQYMPVKGSYPFATVQFRCERVMAAGVLAELCAEMPVEEGEYEPRMNILCRKSGKDEVEFTVIPRRAHRPSFYGDGEGMMLLSPASVDLAGTLVTVRREDFDRVDSEILEKLFSEVCRTK